MRRNEKGITLIALVITIIVLIIIAGVAIAMISGNNGIFTKSGEAVARNEIGAVQDQCVVTAAETVTNYWYGLYVNNTTIGENAVNYGEGYSVEKMDNIVLNQIVGLNSSYPNIEIAQVTSAASTSGTLTTKASFTLTYKSVARITGTIDNGKITWTGYTYTDTGLTS